MCFRNRRNFAAVTASTIGFWLISTAIFLVSFFHFVQILFELRKLKKLRTTFAQQSDVISVNEQDKPLDTTREERAAKSLVLIYFIHFFAISLSFVIAYVKIIVNYSIPDDPNGQTFQVWDVVLLTVQFFTTSNPAYLILSNKLLRKQVKGLFKCELYIYIQIMEILQSITLAGPKV